MEVGRWKLGEWKIERRELSLLSPTSNLQSPISTHGLVIILFSVCLLVVGCSGAVAARPIPYSTYTFSPVVTPTATPKPIIKADYQVKRGTIVGTVRARGRVFSARAERLFFEIGGRVQTISVTVGSRVVEGMALAELKTTELENEVQLAEWNLELAYLELKKAQAMPLEDELALLEAELDKAFLALQRAQAAYDIVLKGPGGPGAGASAEGLALQQATLNYEAAVSAYESKSANLKAEEVGLTLLWRKVARAREELTRAQARLDKARLMAPAGGQVYALEISPYDVVRPYQRVMTIVDPTVLEVRANLDEATARKVQVGQEVKITFDVLPDKPLEGRVMEVVPGISKEDESIIYLTTIAFVSRPPRQVEIGMIAGLEIEVERHEGVLLVPTRAVRVIGSRKYVFVVGEDGRLAEVEVETGLSNADQTEIVSGLKEGDAIVVGIYGQEAD